MLSLLCGELGSFSARFGTGCAVRDSKNPSGAVLMFTAAEWSAFTAGVRTGDFD